LGTFFLKIIIFKRLFGLLNLTFIFIARTKLNIIDLILFYMKFSLCHLREEGIALVHLSAHHSEPLCQSVEALPSGFNTKLPYYNTGCRKRQ
jgi:hypothetical protein